MVRYIEYNNTYIDKVKDHIKTIILEEFDFKELCQWYSEKDYEVYKKNGGNFWIVIDENNNIIGTIGLQDEGNDTFKLVGLYVKEEYRGTEISTELFNIVKNYALNKKYTKIILGTYERMSRAINFYRKVGFKEYNRDEDAIFLVLDL